MINWTEVIVSLGGAIISGFFAWISHSKASAAKTHADNAAKSANSINPPKESDNGHQQS